MSTISKKDVFNDTTLNIFTDASITRINNYYQTDSNYFISCPGCVSLIREEVVDLKYDILKDCTNNRGEIYAILLAINSIVKLLPLHPEIQTINIYSDSKISVYGLREWIFKWTVEDNQLINSSGKSVANQDIFLPIIYSIMQLQLNVSIFHLNGHVSYDSPKQRYDFITSFRENNLIPNFLSNDLVDILINYNNYIDKFTRDQLTEIGVLEDYLFPLITYYHKFDKGLYKQYLTNYDNSFFKRSQTSY